MALILRIQHAMVFHPGIFPRQASAGFGSRDGLLGSSSHLDPVQNLSGKSCREHGLSMVRPLTMIT
jgi:hypothetical protein